MRCSLVIVTVGVLLRGRLAECFLQKLSLEEQSKPRTSPNNAAISTGGDEPVESPRWIPTVNETSPTAPWLPCRRQTDCGGALVCLSSGTCGCPDSAPVLQSGGNGIVCVSHSLALNPLKATVFPVAFLILGVVILGALGYQRIQNPSGVKAAPPRENLTLAPENQSAHISEQHAANIDGSSPEQECREGSESDNSGCRLHPFALSTSQFQGTASLHRQWAQPAPRTADIKADKEDRVGSIRECTKHVSPNAQSSLLLEPSDAGKRKLTRKYSAPGDAQQEMVEASIQGNASANTGAVAPAMTRNPSIPPKKRRSTLSGNQLIGPSHVDRRIDFNCCLEKFPAAVPDNGKRQSIPENGMSCLCGKGTHDTEIPSGCHARPLQSDKLAESELKGGSAPKNTRSASSVVTSPTQTRPVASAQPAPSHPDLDEQGEDLPCCGPGCGHIHFYGPSVESMSTFEWRTESCMKLFADGVSECKNSRCFRTCSLATWPCGRIVYKSPERRARTCETFPVHHDAAEPEGIQDYLLKTAAIRVPWIPLASGSMRSASGDYTRRSRAAPQSRMVSYAAQSIDVVAMVPRLCSSVRPGSTEEPLNGTNTSRRRSTRGSPYQSSPHVTWDAREAPFSHGKTPD